MVKKILCQGYLWLLLLLLYAPIFIIMIYSFTEAKVLGNWTGFSTKLYSSLFVAGTHHSLTNALVNTLSIAFIAATVSTLMGWDNSSAWIISGASFGVFPTTV